MITTGRWKHIFWNYCLSTFPGIKTLYFLPYLIAVAYILLFAYLDKYPYDQRTVMDDQALFQRVAMNIADGGKFSGSVDAEKVFCPTRPPLYPLLIAFTWKMTHSRSLVYIRSIQAICYLLSIYFIFRIATILADGDTQYGFLASLFASLIPHTAAVTHVILAESLGIFLLTFSVLLMVQYREKPRPSYLMLLGLALGLLTLQRPNFLYIPVMFAGYLACSSYRRGAKKMLAVIVLIVVSFLITLAPWSLYKAEEKIDSYSPAYGIGFNLMSGILEKSPQLNTFLLLLDEKDPTWNVDRKRYYAEMEDILDSKQKISSVSADFSPGIRTLIGLALRSFAEAWYLDPAPPDSVILSDRFLTKISLLWIESHPIKFLSSIMNNAGNLVAGNYQPLIYYRLHGILYGYISISRFLLYLFFLAGMFFAVRSKRRDIIFAPLMVVAYLVAVHSLMHADPRYFVYSYMLMAVTIPSIVRGPGRKRMEEARR